MKILLTGIDGYIASIFKTILLNTEHEVLYSNSRDIDQICSRLKYEEFDAVIHCGAPGSTYNYSAGELTEGIYDNTLKLINICEQKRIHLIYPGSMVVFQAECNLEAYGFLKTSAMNVISNSKCNYTILNFPRVYSGERKKGLIQKIRDREIKVDQDMIGKINFATKDFIEDQLADLFEDDCFFKVNGIINLKTDKNLKILDIQELFNL